jgi:ABC-2 type transport system permease protein
MSLKRIGILFRKELFQGPRGFIFIWAIIMPIVISFVLSAVFGTLTSEKPKLGVLDEGNSQLPPALESYDSIRYREFSTESAIRRAVEDGAVDVGIIIPDGFDAAVMQGDDTEITAYIWGESLAKDRTVLLVTLANMIRDMADQQAPVEIETVTLGEKEIIPWSARLLPLIMLFAVFVGGVFIPATSLIDEKEKNTLTALIVTPTSVMDVFISKGLLGFLLSMFVGIIVLAVNQALGVQPLLLIAVLALGGIMAVELGMICGALLKDVSTLFALWKSAAILLFGPAIIYMFPQIPQWIGRVFPTYYMLEPIMVISQRGANWTEIALNVFILIGIDVLIFGFFILSLRRARHFLK